MRSFNQGKLPERFDKPNPQTDSDLLVVKTDNKVSVGRLLRLSELKQLKTADNLC